MSDHCPACTVAREIREHIAATDVQHPRRSAFNFARIIAERACPEYLPAVTEEPK